MCIHTHTHTHTHKIYIYMCVLDICDVKIAYLCLKNDDSTLRTHCFSFAES